MAILRKKTKRLFVISAVFGLCILCISDVKSQQNDIQLEVKATMLGDEKLALINGKAMKIGDKIVGAIILDIGQGYVMFDYNGHLMIEEVVGLEKNIDKEANLRAYNQRMRKNQEALHATQTESLSNSHYDNVRDVCSMAMEYGKSQKTIEKSVGYCEKCLQEIEDTFNKTDSIYYEFLDHLIELKKDVQYNCDLFKRRLDAKKGAEEYLRMTGN